VMPVSSVLLLCTAALAVPSGTLIDRVVAVVDKQVVTQSELLTEARVALVLREGEQAVAAEFDAQALRAFLDYVVNQLLVAAQARRLGVADVATADVERELQHMVQRFRSPDAYRAFLRRFDISEDALRIILERRLRNDRFIADRMRLVGVGGAADPASPAYLQALRRWLDELRDAADIRLHQASGELELQPKHSLVGAPLEMLRGSE
jgi:hypothetical protein